MKLTGTYEILGSEEEIWNALHSPERLRKIVPGCTAIDQLDDGRLKVMVTTQVGPMKINFEGSMAFEDITPHTSFRIEGQGEGGPAGFVKGTADISLENAGDGKTILTYEANSEIGGKLASLGGRLLEAISRKNVDDFFRDLQQELSGTGTSNSPEAIARTIRTPSAPTQSSLLPRINTILLAAAVVALWIIALK